MITPVYTRTKFNYAPISDRLVPEAERTYFVLQMPGVAEQERSENEARKVEMKGTKTVQINTEGTAKLTLLRDCLKDWKNFGSVEFKGGNAIDESLDLIPQDIREEIHSFLTRNKRHLKMFLEDAIERGLKIEDNPDLAWIMQ